MKHSITILLCLPLVSAFTSTSRSQKSFVSSTRLFDVPAPSTNDNVNLKSKADREKPPQSFFELNMNCARAAKLAIADGHKLIEVEVCTTSFSWCCNT